MDPGSPLRSQPSPTKKSSQELPFFPHLAPTTDAADANNNTSTSSRLPAVPEPEPEPEPAAYLTASLIAYEMDVANEMDVDSGAGGAEASAAAQPPHPPQQPAAPSSQAQMQAARRRSPVRTPELQTVLPQRQATTAANGYAKHGHANGHHHHHHPAAAAAPVVSPPRGGSQAPASQAASSSPGTPGHVPPFDWEEFEARYEQALAEMNGEEKELLEEFDQLVNYFNVWASAAAEHDDERAVKRLQTRERYVKIAEQSLGQRKQHLTEVVRAFQSALALLSQT